MIKSNGMFAKSLMHERFAQNWYECIARFVKGCGGMGVNDDLGH